MAFAASQTEPWKRLFSLIAKGKTTSVDQKIVYATRALRARSYPNAREARIDPDIVNKRSLRALDNPLIRFMLGTDVADAIPFGNVTRAHLAAAEAAVSHVHALIEVTDLDYASEILDEVTRGGPFRFDVNSVPERANRHTYPKLGEGVYEELKELFDRENELDYEFYEHLRSRKATRRVQIPTESNTHLAAD